MFFGGENNYFVMICFYFNTFISVWIFGVFKSVMKIFYQKMDYFEPFLLNFTRDASNCREHCTNTVRELQKILFVISLPKKLLRDIPHILTKCVAFKMFRLCVISLHLSSHSLAMETHFLSGVKCRQSVCHQDNTSVSGKRKAFLTVRTLAFLREKTLPTSHGTGCVQGQSLFVPLGNMCNNWKN